MRKLIATICAIVMVMALAFSALAAGSPTAPIAVTGAIAATSANVAPAVAAAMASATPTAGWVAITEWLIPVADANGDTVLGCQEFKAYAGSTLPGDAYALQIVLPDGTLGILDLTGFAVDAEGNVVIPAGTMPAGCAFRILAKVAA